MENGLAMLPTFLAMSIGLIVAISIPLVSMWSLKQVVGQREPPRWFRRTAHLLIAVGVCYGCWRMFLSFAGEAGLLNGLLLAWVLGSAIASLVTFQEAHYETDQTDRRPDEF